MRNLKNKQPLLWGNEKKSSHLEDNTLLMIYKDVSGLGNLALYTATKSWIRNSQRCLAYNIKKLRPVLIISEEAIRF